MAADFLTTEYVEHDGVFAIQCGNCGEVTTMESHDFYECGGWLYCLYCDEESHVEPNMNSNG